MNGLKNLNANLNTDCHGLLNQVKDVVTKEMQTIGVQLPAPINRRVSGSTIKLKIVYSGTLDEPTQQRVKRVLETISNSIGVLLVSK